MCCEHCVRKLRAVIVLDPTLKIDEVDVSYKQFIVQYRGLIIKEIVKDKGWTITKASNYLDSKFMGDKYVYDIMNKILREHDIRIILNRNPEYCGVVKSYELRGVA